jgi:hypothetical protein
MAPDGVTERRFKTVERLVEQRLRDRPGWPLKFLKLECETFGIHQNEAGKSIDKLEEDGSIKQGYQIIDNKPRTFILRPDEDDISSMPIFQRTCEAYDFLGESGHFANLIAYIVLCKVFDELHQHIDIDVLPEGTRPMELPHAGNRNPDAFIRLPREKNPVEVYNGADYLSKRSNKYREQLPDLNSPGDHPVNSNPVLINRRADDDVRKGVRKMNGMVIDTDCILTTESTYSEYQDSIELFNIDSLVYDLPPLKVANGDRLTGEEYDSLDRNSQAANKLRPPSEMVDDLEAIPKQYRQRLRGGVKLLYVNSIYRRSTDPVKNDACYVLQTIYNQLLREGGKTRDEAIRQGWDGAQKGQNQYKRIAVLENRDGERKKMVLDKVNDLLTKLKDENIICKRNGQLHAHKATHPQQSLSFS